MFLKTQFNSSEDPIPADNNSREYAIQKDFSAAIVDSQPNITQRLLNEIMRVKELIKKYKSSGENSSRSHTELLEELVLEAYNSLVNYDSSLINKYYDLLQNCD